jgi:hypothetical protein
MIVVCLIQQILAAKAVSSRPQLGTSERIVIFDAAAEIAFPGYWCISV